MRHSIFSSYILLLSVSKISGFMIQLYRFQMDRFHFIISDFSKSSPECNHIVTAPFTLWSGRFPGIRIPASQSISAIFIRFLLAPYNSNARSLAFFTLYLDRRAVQSGDLAAKGQSESNASGCFCPRLIYHIERLRHM